MNDPEQQRVDAEPASAKNDFNLGVITQPPQPDDTPPYRARFGQSSRCDVEKLSRAGFGQGRFNGVHHPIRCQELRRRAVRNPFTEGLEYLGNHAGGQLERRGQLHPVLRRSASPFLGRQGLRRRWVHVQQRHSRPGALGIQRCDFLRFLGFAQCGDIQCVCHSGYRIPLLRRGRWAIFPYPLDYNQLPPAYNNQISICCN